MSNAIDITTCKDKVISVLKRGGWWINEDIKAIIGNQNNTIAKELSWLIQDGFVISESVPGKSIYRYKWITKDIGRETLSLNVNETSTVPVAVEAIRSNEPARPNFYNREYELIKKIEDVLRNYPIEHIEYRKGMLQMEQLRKRVAA